MGMADFVETSISRNTVTRKTHKSSSQGGLSEKGVRASKNYPELVLPELSATILEIVIFSQVGVQDRARILYRE